MARAQKSEMAKTIRPAATDSTVAGLENKATTQSATAPRSAALKTGPNFTGQYLYDRFCTNDADTKEDNSKMDVVRQMAASLDVASFKKTVGEFVGIAKSYRDKAIDADKAEGVYNKDNPSIEVREASARYKTAQNHQTVMRIGYGAIRFAAQQLVALGAGGDIGYLLMREVGAKALDEAGVKWDGTKAESKEAKAARADQREETEAMLEVQESHPRKPNESRADYYARIDKAVEKRMEERAAERREKSVNALADKLRKMLADNEDIREEVLDRVLAQPELEEAKPDVQLH